MGWGGLTTLSEHDVILVIDDPTPWTTTNPPATTTIISMDVDPMRFRYPLSDIPVHIPITCNSALAIPVLNDMCDEFITSSRQTAFDARKAELQVSKAAADEAAAASIQEASTKFPLSDAWLVPASGK